MKIALTIFCSLFLVLGQAVVVSVPVASAGHAEKNCGCGGKMKCCVAKPGSSSQPLPATAVVVSSQNQILSPLPAVVVWVLSATATPSFFPAAAPSLTTAVAPIFARNCSRLL